MSATVVDQLHPLRAAVRAAAESLAGVADLQPSYLSAGELASLLREVASLEAQAAELRLRVMAQAGAAIEAVAAKDAGAWAAGVLKRDHRPSRADTELAKALDSSYVVTAAALKDGSLSLEHARVVVQALDELPDRLGSELVTRAEADLVAYAMDFRPSELRHLGRRILDVIAPEIADEEEARRLEKAEEEARRATSMRFRALGDGRNRITLILSDEPTARLMTYADAFTSPRHSDDGIGVTELDRIPIDRRRGQAFCALLEHLDPAKLPAHGGDATTVLVTVPLDNLLRDLATAGLVDADLDAGANLTATQARRLACTARIIPAVLGGKGEILDLGRSQRLFNAAQRKALRLRDKRCRADGCTIPATWCEAHHLDPWSTGGRTDLKDGVLLCSHHHHRVHDRAYDVDRLPNGDYRFHLRT